MKFSCDQCQAQYMIADEKVGPKGVKVRCKKCGHIISVTKEAGDAQAAAPSASGGGAAPGSAFDDIFGNTGGASAGDEGSATKVFTTSELDKVRQEQNLAKGSVSHEPSSDEPPTQQMQIQKAEWYLAIHDEQVGPISVDDVQVRWDKGEINAQTLGWKAGLQDWQPVAQIGELAHLTARPQAQSKAAAVAAEAAKPAPEPEKPKETVTWRPSGASALADLAKEASIEAPKPAPVVESPPVPDFNPAQNNSDPFGGFNAGPSTVWQFPTASARKSSNGTSKVLVAAVAIIGVVVAGAVGAFALGYLPAKGPNYNLVPGGQVAQQPGGVQPATQPVGTQPALPPVATNNPPPTPPPTQANPTPPAQGNNPPATAKEPKEPKGKKKGGKTSGGGDDGGDDPPEAAPPPKKAPKGDDNDPFGNLTGGNKSDLKPTLGRDDVLGVVKANLAGVQKCASAYSAGGGKLPPKLILKWVIKPSGNTSDHELINPELKGTQVDSCIVASLKKWKFPEYREGNIPVTYPVAISQ